MLITNTITMAIDRQQMPPVIYAVQGEANSRAIKMQLTMGGKPWNVPSDVSCFVRFGKPDKTGGIYDTLEDGTSAVEIGDNYLQFLLAEQVISCPGDVFVQVEMTKNEASLSTFSVVVRVQEDKSIGSFESKDYYNLRKYVYEEIKNFFDDDTPTTAMTVTFSGNANSGYKADKTFSEVSAALSVGLTVIGVLKSAALNIVLDNVLMESEQGYCSFNGQVRRYAGGEAIPIESWTAILHSGDTVEVFSEDIATAETMQFYLPAKLPNPYALTIDGQIYDGSSTVVVNTEDGKVKTVNGIAPDENGNVKVEINGISDAAKALLVSILRNAVYSTNQSANITALEQELASSGSGSGGDSGGEDSGGGTETVTYTVTNTLSNVTTNNALVSVAENAVYTATLTAVDGYELDSVTVAMGGVDITATAYSAGVVSIAAVTGNVVITATAKASSSGGGVVNLFDKDTMAISGAYVGAQGKLSTSATSKYAKIPISTGTYALQKGSGWAMSTTGHPALIDIDGNMLCHFGNLQANGKAGTTSDSAVGTIAQETNENGIAVTVLSDAVTHIIFSICVNGGTDDTDTTMMEVGDTCHDYVAYA
jgi:hypothetical protein